jgi:type VI secretion system protein ImpA
MDETILDPIPGDNPSGANLRYEVVYAEIRARVRRARGEVLPDPDDPNFHGADMEWRFVIGACRDLLRRRSKDLMLAAWLTEAQLAVDGLAGLRDGLDTLRGLLEKFWQTLYPEIEDGDVEARMRVLEWLAPQLATGVETFFAADSKAEDPAGPKATGTRTGCVYRCTQGVGRYLRGKLRL